jgi:hypothetical protein
MLTDGLANEIISDPKTIVRTLKLGSEDNTMLGVGDMVTTFEQQGPNGKKRLLLTGAGRITINPDQGGLILSNGMRFRTKHRIVGRDDRYAHKEVGKEPVNDSWEVILEAEEPSMRLLPKEPDNNLTVVRGNQLIDLKTPEGKVRAEEMIEEGKIKPDVVFKHSVMPIDIQLPVKEVLFDAFAENLVKSTGFYEIANIIELIGDDGSVDNIVADIIQRNKDIKQSSHSVQQSLDIWQHGGQIIRYLEAYQEGAITKAQIIRNLFSLGETVLGDRIKLSVDNKNINRDGLSVKLGSPDSVNITEFLNIDEKTFVRNLYDKAFNLEVFDVGPKEEKKRESVIQRYKRLFIDKLEKSGKRNVGIGAAIGPQGVGKDTMIGSTKTAIEGLKTTDIDADVQEKLKTIFNGYPIVTGTGGIFAKQSAEYVSHASLKNSTYCMVDNGDLVSDSITNLEVMMEMYTNLSVDKDKSENINFNMNLWPRSDGQYEFLMNNLGADMRDRGINLLTNLVQVEMVNPEEAKKINNLHPEFFILMRDVYDIFSDKNFLDEMRQINIEVAVVGWDIFEENIQKIIDGITEKIKEQYKGGDENGLLDVAISMLTKPFVRIRERTFDSLNAEPPEEQRKDDREVKKVHNRLVEYYGKSGLPMMKILDVVLPGDCDGDVAMTFFMEKQIENWVNGHPDNAAYYADHRADFDKFVKLSAGINKTTVDKFKVKKKKSP